MSPCRICPFVEFGCPVMSVCRVCLSRAYTSVENVCLSQALSKSICLVCLLVLYKVCLSFVYACASSMIVCRICLSISLSVCRICLPVEYVFLSSTYSKSIELIYLSMFLSVQFVQLLRISVRRISLYISCMSERHIC
jgi:hypothetical protein